MSGKDAEPQATKHGDFAHRLRELRRQRDLSQAELAEQVEVHSTHISRYERCLSRPSADTLKRLADVLGVSGDYLLEEATKEIVKELLDAFLTKRQVQQLAAR